MAALVILREDRGTQQHSQPVHDLRRCHARWRAGCGCVQLGISLSGQLVWDASWSVVAERERNETERLVLSYKRKRLRLYSASLARSHHVASH